MNAPNFSSILDKPVTEVKRPKPIPVGTYLCIVDGIPKFDKTKNENATDTVEFNLKPVTPQPDVDQAALAEALDGKSLSEVNLRANFFLTEKAVYRLDEFLYENLGIEFGIARKEAISRAPGNQVLAYVVHANSKDGKATYANVGSTARV
jgi:hypothetical protein